MIPTRRPAAVAAAAVAALAVAVAVPPAVAAGHPARPQPPKGFWVAGDLHVHTIYGHDTCIDPTTAWDYTSPDRSARKSCDAAYTVSFTPTQRFAEALSRGLDYLAISDHNNVVNQTDPDEMAWLRAHPSFIRIPAYENSQPGHVQMLGATGCYGNDGLIPGATVMCDTLVADKSAAGETAMADALRADGGVFQINHPSDGNWDRALGHSVVPDTVEVWNIGPWAYQHPLPASNDNDWSLNWYDEFLRAGYEVGATGGSDSHWVTTDSVQGVGEPTTWVFVRARTTQGVLDGLRAHHTFVSALPPAFGGAKLFLEADRNGDGVFDAIAGDEVGPAAVYRVRAVGALPGSLVRIVTDTGQVDLPLGAASELTFRPGVGGVPAAALFVRAELLLPDGRDQRRATCDQVLSQAGSTECHDNLAMQALTSPIFVR